jgi:hypothetical protein
MENKRLVVLVAWGDGMRRSGSDCPRLTLLAFGRVSCGTLLGMVSSILGPFGQGDGSQS